MTIFLNLFFFFIFYIVCSWGVAATSLVNNLTEKYQKQKSERNKLWFSGQLSIIPFLQLHINGF